MLFNINNYCRIEVVAVDKDQATLASTVSAVVSVWGTTSSRKLDVVSRNNVANNELPTPTATSRFDVDNFFQHGHTTPRGKPGYFRY